MMQFMMKSSSLVSIGALPTGAEPGSVFTFFLFDLPPPSFFRLAAASPQRHSKIETQYILLTLMLQHSIGF
jgi:hypothetical protein